MTIIAARSAVAADRSAPALSADRRPGAGPAHSRPGGRESRPGPGRIHLALRARAGCTCWAKPRSVTSTRSTAEERRQRLEAFFDFDLPCVFVTKGQEVPARAARSRPGARGAVAAEPAQDGGVLPPHQAVPRGGVRSAHHAAWLAGRRVRGWVCSSSAVRVSARANACWTWSSGDIAWWPTTWCR